MYNTPSTYAIYMSGLVFRLQAQGGVKKIEAVNRLKAQTLYETIDGSGGFYINRIRPNARSKMNVVFQTGDEELDRRFVLEASCRAEKLPVGKTISLSAGSRQHLQCDAAQKACELWQIYARFPTALRLMSRCCLKRLQTASAVPAFSGGVLGCGGKTVLLSGYPSFSIRA